MPGPNPFGQPNRAGTPNFGVGSGPVFGTSGGGTPPLNSTTQETDIPDRYGETRRKIDEQWNVRTRDWTVPQQRAELDRMLGRGTVSSGQRGGMGVLNPAQMANIMRAGQQNITSAGLEADFRDTQRRDQLLSNYANSDVAQSTEEHAQLADQRDAASLALRADETRARLEIERLNAQNNALTGEANRMATLAALNDRLRLT